VPGRPRELANTPPKSENYRQPEADSPLRPDVGTQPQFSKEKKKPPDAESSMFSVDTPPLFMHKGASANNIFSFSIFQSI